MLLSGREIETKRKLIEMRQSRQRSISEGARAYF